MLVQQFGAMQGSLRNMRDCMNDGFDSQTAASDRLHDRVSGILNDMKGTMTDMKDSVTDMKDTMTDMKDSVTQFI